MVLSTSEKLASLNPAVRREGQRELQQQTTTQAGRTVSRAKEIASAGFAGTVAPSVIEKEISPRVPKAEAPSVVGVSPGLLKPEIVKTVKEVSDFETRVGAFPVPSVKTIGDIRGEEITFVRELPQVKKRLEEGEEIKVIEKRPGMEGLFVTFAPRAPAKEVGAKELTFFGGLVAGFRKAEKKVSEKLRLPKLLPEERIEKVSTAISKRFKKAEESLEVLRQPRPPELEKFRIIPKGFVPPPKLVSATKEFSVGFAEEGLRGVREKPLKMVVSAGLGVATTLIPPSKIATIGLRVAGGVFVVGKGAQVALAETPKAKGGILGETLTTEIIPFTAGAAASRVVGLPKLTRQLSKAGRVEFAAEQLAKPRTIKVKAGAKFEVAELKRFPEAKFEDPFTKVTRRKAPVPTRVLEITAPKGKEPPVVLFESVGKGIETKGVVVGATQRAISRVQTRKEPITFIQRVTPRGEARTKILIGEETFAVTKDVFPRTRILFEAPKTQLKIRQQFDIQEQEFPFISRVVEKGLTTKGVFLKAPPEPKLFKTTFKPEATGLIKLAEIRTAQVAKQPVFARGRFDTGIEELVLGKTELKFAKFPEELKPFTLKLQQETFQFQEPAIVESAQLVRPSIEAELSFVKQPPRILRRFGKRGELRLEPISEQKTELVRPQFLEKFQEPKFKLDIFLDQATLPKQRISTLGILREKFDLVNLLKQERILQVQLPEQLTTPELFPEISQKEFTSQLTGLTTKVVSGAERPPSEFVSEFPTIKAPDKVPGIIGGGIPLLPGFNIRKLRGRGAGRFGRMFRPSPTLIAIEQQILGKGFKFATGFETIRPIPIM